MAIISICNIGMILIASDILLVYYVDKTYIILVGF